MGNPPKRYRVLFLQGGATLQFAGVPLNLMCRGGAGYVVTGLFSKKAQQEAMRYGKVEVLATGEADGFSRIPDLAPAEQRAAAGDPRLHPHLPEQHRLWHHVPRASALRRGATRRRRLEVASFPCRSISNSRALRYGLVYAGAQKNAGAAGVTVVIVRDELLAQGSALPYCPTYLDYRQQANAGSMLNTPNTFGIYLCGKVFKWVEDHGGLAGMEARNREKARLIYEVLDRSRVFHPCAEPGSRSIANVTFRCTTPELDAAFIAGARERGIEGVKGHRAVGGMRASIYNAVSLEDVQALVAYMEEFESEHQIE